MKKLIFVCTGNTCRSPMAEGLLKHLLGPDCGWDISSAGGCAANALHATGDIHGVYEYGCEVFRKRIECALMIKVAESLDPELAGRAATAAPATDEDCGDCSSCE